MRTASSRSLVIATGALLLLAGVAFAGLRQADDPVGNPGQAAESASPEDVRDATASPEASPDDEIEDRDMDEPGQDEDDDEAVASPEASDDDPDESPEANESPEPDESPEADD
jgi:hypothetical protein